MYLLSKHQAKYTRTRFGGYVAVERPIQIPPTMSVRYISAQFPMSPARHPPNASKHLSIVLYQARFSRRSGPHPPCARPNKCPNVHVPFLRQTPVRRRPVSRPTRTRSFNRLRELRGARGNAFHPPRSPAALGRFPHAHCHRHFPLRRRRCDPNFGHKCQRFIGEWCWEAIWRAAAAGRRHAVCGETG